MLFDAPRELPKAPAGLRVIAFGGDAGHAARDREVADRVDHIGEGDVEREIGRWEYADGVLVISRAEGAVDGKGTAVLDLFTGGCASADVERVFDGCQSAVSGGWKVAGNEVREGKFLHAILRGEEFGFGEEVPFVEVFDLCGAFAATVGDGSFGGRCALEVHGDGLENRVIAGGSDA